MRFPERIPRPLTFNSFDNIYNSLFVHKFTPLEFQASLNKCLDVSSVLPSRFSPFIRAVQVKIKKLSFSHSNLLLDFLISYYTSKIDNCHTYPSPVIIHIFLAAHKYMYLATSVVNKYLDVAYDSHNNADWLVREVEQIIDTAQPSTDNFNAFVWRWVNWSDDRWAKKLPPRTKADFAIRRSFFRDVLSILFKNLDPTLQQQLQKQKILIARTDMTTTGNILTYLLIILNSKHKKLFEKLSLIKLLTFSVETLIDIAGKITKATKKVISSPEGRELAGLFSELGGLTGFRCSPFSGYDPEGDVLEFCESGGRRHEPVVGSDRYRSIWLKNVYRSASFASQKVLSEPTSLLEFIRDVKFDETKGSSSIGRLEVSVRQDDGSYKTTRIKARKNLITMCSDPEAIAEQCERHVRNVMTGIEKNELGKIRTAVSSPLEQFLLEQHAKERFDKNWAKKDPLICNFSGLDEEFDFFSGLASRMEGRYVLPFDYKAGDHQISEEELDDVLWAFKCHSPDPDRWEKLRSLNKRRFMVNPKTRKLIPVLGGLSSGSNLTTDSWNLFSPNTFRTLVEYFDVRGASAVTKGDDCIFMFDDYATAIYVRTLYTAVRIEAGFGKFTILNGGGDFLRTFVGRDHVQGVVARAIPLLYQRRPWSSPPVSAAEKCAVVSRQFSTVLRRARVPLHRVSELCHELNARLAKRLFTPRVADLVRTSTVCGGLGLDLKPKYSRLFLRRPENNFGNHIDADIRVPHINEWFRHAIQVKAEDFHPAYKGIRSLPLEKLLKTLTKGRLASDDVPGLAKVMRYAHHQVVNQLKPRALPASLLPSYLSSEVSWVARLVANSALAAILEKNRGPPERTIDDVLRVYARPVLEKTPEGRALLATPTPRVIYESEVRSLVGERVSKCLLSYHFPGYQVIGDKIGGKLSLVVGRELLKYASRLRRLYLSMEVHDIDDQVLLQIASVECMTVKFVIDFLPTNSIFNFLYFSG